MLSHINTHWCLYHLKIVDTPTLTEMVPLSPLCPSHLPVLHLQQIDVERPETTQLLSVCIDALGRGRSALWCVCDLRVDPSHFMICHCYVLLKKRMCGDVLHCVECLANSTSVTSDSRIAFFTADILAQ